MGTAKEAALMVLEKFWEPTKACSFGQFSSALFGSRGSLRGSGFSSLWASSCLSQKLRVGN